MFRSYGRGELKKKFSDPFTYSLRDSYLPCHFGTPFVTKSASRRYTLKAAFDGFTWPDLQSLLKKDGIRYRKYILLFKDITEV